MKAKGTKFISIMLILMMLMSYFCIIGEVVAASLEDQGVNTNHANVEFDAYFLEENSMSMIPSKKVHSSTKQIGAENYIYFAINVKNAGYISDGTITINNPNFEISKDIKSSYVAGIEENKENNTITLKLNRMTSTQNPEVIKVPINYINKEKIVENELYRETEIKFNTDYIDNNGKTNKNIGRNINVKTVWTAEKTSEINTEVISAENGFVQVLVKSKLKDNIFPVKQTKLEITSADKSISYLKPVYVKANSTAATNGDEEGISFDENNYEISDNKVIITVNNNADANGNITWKKNNKEDEFIIVYEDQLYKEKPNNGVNPTLNIQVNVSSEITVYDETSSNVTNKYSNETPYNVQMQYNDTILDFVKIETPEYSIPKGKLYSYRTFENQETITMDINDSYYKAIYDEKGTYIGRRVLLENEESRYDRTNKLIINKQNFKDIFGEDGYILIWDTYTENNKKCCKFVNKIDINTQADENGNVILFNRVSLNDLTNVRIETSPIKNEGKFKIISERKVNLQTENVKDLKIHKSTMNVTLGDTIKYEIVEKNNNTSQAYYLNTDRILKNINDSETFLDENIIYFNQIDEQIKGKQAKCEINFTEPTSQAKLNLINGNRILTAAQNKQLDVEMVLKTDTYDCRLYENPVLVLKIPKDIKLINYEQKPYKGVELLGLGNQHYIWINSVRIKEDVDGTNVEIELLGNQGDYIEGSVTEGLKVRFKSDIQFDPFITTREEKIVMSYTNNNTIYPENVENKTKTIETPVYIVAPTGLITASSISNYAQNAPTVTSIQEDIKTAEIGVMQEARKADVEMKIINNYNEPIKNVSILGRTFFKGNKDIITSQDLGTNIDVPLKTYIAPRLIPEDLMYNNSIHVYYSENENATKELNDASNGWTVSPQNLESIKSYLIVMDNRFNTGDSINISYDVTIPGNLQYNQSAYENYVVYFDRVTEQDTISEKKSGSNIGFTTGKGPVVEAKMESNIPETQKLVAGNLIKYTTTVKNTGTEDTENIIASINLPNYLTYIEFENGNENGNYKEDRERKQLNYDLGTLKANDQKILSFWVVVNNLKVSDICKDESHYSEAGGIKYHLDEFKHTDDEYKITTSMKTDIYSNSNKITESNIVKNKIEKSHFNINGYSTSAIDEILNEGEELQYNYTVSLYDDGVTATNTVATMKIPDGLKYENARIRTYNLAKGESEYITDGINYDSTTRMLTINLGNVTSSINGTIEINTIVENLPNGVYEKKIISTLTAKADEITEETSKEIINNVGKQEVKITQTSSITPGEIITAAEDYSYIYEIENIGGKTAEAKFKTKIPEELQYISSVTEIGQYQDKSYDISKDNVVEFDISIPKGEKAKITINVVAKELQEDKKISSVGEVSSEKIDRKVSNVINHTIKAMDYNDKPGVMIKKISGQVWEDTNGNGIKDDDEKRTSDVEVMLYDNNAGKLVLDNEGKVLKVVTDEEGKYTFSDIPEGIYTVIYLYDSANYSATAYKVNTQDSTKDSDAMDTQITIDGKIMNVAATAPITLQGKNIYDIDLGLIKDPKFNLKLDKTISKLTLQYGNKTEVYNYNDSSLVKKDLIGKDVKNITILVEYKIKVSNIGGVSGYAKKIADYLPKEMKFNSELNKDWYLDEKGVAINSSLADTVINPGESKEVTIVLTKKLTEDNLGLYHNEAEIYEAYNEFGLEDISSKPGNKISAEDDISYADIVMTVKTGEAIICAGLIIAIISIIGVGAFVIKRKILK